MTQRTLLIACFALLGFGCSEGGRENLPGLDLSVGGGNKDGGKGGNDMAMMSCDPNSPDQAGCSCTAGTTRACYDGPASTRNKGICMDGTQTCSGGGGEFGGTFGPCTGETLPGSESGHCSDGVDNDCNGEVDCADGQCETSPSCSQPDLAMSQPDLAMGGGCALPDLNGRCPQGTFFGIDPQTFSFGCCPCDANHCDQPSCCITQACAGAQQCQMCNGASLDPACQGKVDGDCDDFPEDCDQLCCPCKPVGACMQCPQGQIDCSQVGMGCVDGTSDPSHCGACDIACSPGQNCVSGSCI
jgi:hypothetical protein